MAALSRAEELLVETDLSMAQIARRCGFSSASHFSKVYRDHTGQTPTEGRERLRRRRRHMEAGPLAGVAPSLTMAALGMSYVPQE